MDDLSRRKVIWLLVLLDCTVVLVFLAVAAHAQPSELDLPVLPPGDPRRARYVPAQRPEPPTGDPPKETPAPAAFFGHELVTRNGKAPASVGFVLDKSSSMNRGRWDAVKRETVRAVSALGDTKVGVLVFDSVLPPYYFFSPVLVGGGPRTAQRLAGWLEGHRPLASTSTAPAVISALRTWQPELLVLLTDGAPNVIGSQIYNPEHHRQLIRANNPGVPIHVFGVDVDGDRVAVGFCAGVAGDSGGDFVRLRGLR